MRRCARPGRSTRDAPAASKAVLPDHRRQGLALASQYPVACVLARRLILPIDGLKDGVPQTATDGRARRADGERTAVSVAPAAMRRVVAGRQSSPVSVANSRFRPKLAPKYSTASSRPKPVQAACASGNSRAAGQQAEQAQQRQFAALAFDGGEARRGGRRHVAAAAERGDGGEQQVEVAGEAATLSMAPACVTNSALGHQRTLQRCHILPACAYSRKPGYTRPCRAAPRRAIPAAALKPSRQSSAAFEQIERDEGAVAIEGRERAMPASVSVTRAPPAPARAHDHGLDRAPGDPLSAAGCNSTSCVPSAASTSARAAHRRRHWDQLDGQRPVTDAGAAGGPGCRPSASSAAEELSGGLCASAGSGRSSAVVAI